MPVLARRPPIRPAALRPAAFDAAGAPAFDPPPFQPHRLLRGGHAQTLAAVYWTGTAPFLAPLPGARFRRHRVDLGDGDALALHDLTPADWSLGDPVVLLVHGLGGSADSPYMVRIAAKLADRGVRAVRMDHRTCGAGADLSRQPYHAGLSGDVRASAWFLCGPGGLCPGSPLGLAGFSMGGNMVLKTLGEHAEAERAGSGPPDRNAAEPDVGSPGAGEPGTGPPEVPPGTPPHAQHPWALPDVPLRGVAVNPAADLAACCDSLTGPVQRFYDRYFAKHLTRHVTTATRVCGQQVRALEKARPRRIRDFDAAVTVPGWRYESVDHYYARESAAPLVRRIDAPTLILTAEDDPLVPADVVRGLTPGAGVHIHVCEGGGHLGYIAREPRGDHPDADRRWMDWRVVDWLTAPAAAPP
ncbi:YheT family hydrolase, partial [Alienimonas sp. DA493]|uniref:YheT family hydrolase n=1 Tax=Alienimonas sp. DA493 TaxID=3373605 RepID=UPI003753F8B9